jgi:hypothetical protein
MAAVAALEVAKDAGPDDVIVVLLPDSGRGYLQKVFDDDWMALYGFSAPHNGENTWGRQVGSLSAPLLVSHSDDEGDKRHQMLTDSSRAVGVVSKQHAPLQPGDIRGWFNLSNPGVIRSSGDIVKVGWAQEYDPEFTSPHPIAVMKDGKVIAVVTTKEIQAGT